MKSSSSKIILIVMIALCVLSQSTVSSGQEAVRNLKGEWLGSGLLCATAGGFSPSKDTIKINIYEQEGLKFKGKIERSYHGNIILQDVEGSLDKYKYNICLVDQKNKNVIVGHVTSHKTMKLYYWDNRENNQITVYILRKN